MNEGQWVSLVGLLGALILVGSGFRGHRVGARKTVSMAMIWIGIFAVVALVFGMIQ